MERTSTTGFPIWRLLCAVAGAALVAAGPLVAQTSGASALDRIRESGRIRIGYRTDARPFSYRDDAGKPAGYSIELWQQLADTVKAELKVGSLTTEWVPVAAVDRFTAVQQGRVDLLCAADSVTLERRGLVSFSIPIFPGGIGAVVRTDAPIPLREVLSGRAQTFRPTWRASASRVLRAKSFAVVAGTTSEKWLAGRIDELKILTTETTVASYDAGIEALLERNVDALFGERAILLDAAQRHPAKGDLLVIDRLFTHEPLAFATPLNDEPFRLAIDTALTRFYESGRLAALYTKWFGEPDASAISFFRWSALPD